MSLPSKATTVNFYIKDGTTNIVSHLLTVSNLDVIFTPILWEERTGLSITGKKRKANIVRGYDARVVLQWEDIRNQETEIIDFLDDLKVAADNDYSIRFSVFGESDFLYVIPEDGIEYTQSFINQVTKRTPVSMSFEIDTLRSDISYDGVNPP